MAQTSLLSDDLLRDLMAVGQVDVVVECRSMEGYDLDARGAFVDWNSRMRSHIAHLAVLTDRAMWKLVVSGMALASRQTMRAFPARPEALEWFGRPAL